jgi:hypothetical protein
VTVNLLEVLHYYLASRLASEASQVSFYSRLEYRRGDTQVEFYDVVHSVQLPQLLLAACIEYAICKVMYHVDSMAY